MELSKLKINPNNPQKFDDLSKLERSIREFPKMMELRPIIYDGDFMVLGGNKRLICLQNLGFKDIPNNWTKSAEDLTPEEKKRFIITDNVGFGEWDKKLLKEWDKEDLESWGIELIDWNFDNEDIEDINEVDEFNEVVNFQIICDNIDQLDELQAKLNISSKKIKYSDFLIKAGL